MSNLTVVIDDDLLRAARIKALQEGTSVNEICRAAIARYAAPALDAAQWVRELSALADRMDVHPDALPNWPSREAMYDEAMAERMPTLWATLEGEPGKPGGSGKP